MTAVLMKLSKPLKTTMMSLHDVRNVHYLLLCCKKAQNSFTTLIEIVEDH